MSSKSGSQRWAQWREAAKGMLRVHLLPCFGSMRLDEIGPADIEAYKATKLEEGLDKKSINNQPVSEDEFLTFSEADRLRRASPPERTAMLTYDLRDPTPHSSRAHSYPAGVAVPPVPEVGVEPRPGADAMSAFPGPASLQLPHAREGSGTSWMPDSSPVFANHLMAGDWTLMLQYAVTFGFDDQGTDRGSSRVASTNWVMGMASHPLAGGMLMLRGMFSAEPATLGGEKALPLLLQSGETYGGQPLHDRQHPHDLFMETAAIYRDTVADSLGVEFYAAASGEPALGPTAYMHRASAMNNPLRPIGHHWQDSTHVSFGVLTAGIYNRWVKLEGSIFHGREPDEDRWNFDFGALDSWSGRLSVNPTYRSSFQVSYGYIQSPEALRPEESLHRLTASGSYGTPLSPSGDLAVTAIWGRNIDPHVSSSSFLVEVNADLDGRHVPFVRVEYVSKLGHDLLIPGDPDAKYGVFQAQLGYVHRFAMGWPVVPTVGAVVDIGTMPDVVAGAYGTNVPIGAYVFVGLQPPRMMPMNDEHQMTGH